MNEEKTCRARGGSGRNKWKCEKTKLVAYDLCRGHYMQMLRNGEFRPLREYRLHGKHPLLAKLERLERREKR